MDSMEKAAKVAELKGYVEELKALKDKTYEIGARMAKGGILISPHVDSVVDLHKTILVLTGVVEQLENGDLYAELEAYKNDPPISREGMGEVEKLVNSAVPKGGWIN